MCIHRWGWRGLPVPRPHKLITIVGSPIPGMTSLMSMYCDSKHTVSPSCLVLVIQVAFSKGMSASTARQHYYNDIAGDNRIVVEDASSINQASTCPQHIERSRS